MYRIGCPPSQEEIIQYTLVTDETSESSIKNDLTYFSPESGPQSYAVYLNRPKGMTQEDIYKFIEAKDQVLFKRLLRDAVNKRPHDQTAFQAHLVHESARVLTSNQSVSEGKVQSCLLMSSAGDDSKAGTLQLSRSDEYDGNDLLILQWKRHIIFSLLNKSVFILHKTSPWASDFKCAYPLCVYDLFNMSKPTYFLTISVPGNVIPLESLPGRVHFCLKCVEGLFVGPKAVENYAKQASCPGTFDGMLEDGLVAAAAERMATRPTALMKEVSEISRFPFQYPSNSPEANYLRRARALEIEDVLKKAQRGEKRVATTLHKTSPTQESPTLIISPPPDMCSFPERYKKQGLGKYDKAKEQEQMVSFAQRMSESSVNLLPKSPAIERSYSLMCYCGEPDDGEDKIKCCFEYCCVGWIHMRCSGLERLPRKGDKWYCRYCADSLRSSIPTTEIDSDTSSLASNATKSAQNADIRTYFRPIETKEILDDDSSSDYGGLSDEEGQQMNFSPRTPEWILRMQGVMPHDFLDGAAAPRQYHPGALFSTGRPPILPPFSQSGTMLPPGHTNTTFADLAPFIHADYASLTPQHVAALAQWKTLCSPSRLFQPPLQPTAKRSPGKTFLNSLRSVLGGEGTEKARFTKLTAVLSDVDRQDFGVGGLNFDFGFGPPTESQFHR